MWMDPEALEGVVVNSVFRIPASEGGTFVDVQTQAPGMLSQANKSFLKASGLGTNSFSLYSCVSQLPRDKVSATSNKKISHRGLSRSP